MFLLGLKACLLRFASLLFKTKGMMDDTIYHLIIVIYYFLYFYVKKHYFYVKNIILGLGDLFPFF